jgi:hypothetical protein
MKGLEYIAIVGGLFLLWNLVKTQETFVPEFLDHTNERVTAAGKHSSFAQRTNHVLPPAGPSIPPQGSETPFRVNMFNSYVP